MTKCHVSKCERTGRKKLKRWGRMFCGRHARQLGIPLTTQRGGGGGRPGGPNQQSRRFIRR